MYTFERWNPKIEAATEDKEYTALYIESVRQYTVTFNSNGGSIVVSQLVDYNTKATKPLDPIKEGHTFEGCVRPW